MAILYAHSAIAQEQIQRIPMPQRVRNRYSQRRFRRSLVPEAVQLLSQLLHARSGELDGVHDRPCLGRHDELPTGCKALATRNGNE